jgi:hypothetical protein
MRRSASLQVTVPEGPRGTVRVRACCGTFLLYGPRLYSYLRITLQEFCSGDADADWHSPRIVPVPCHARILPIFMLPRCGPQDRPGGCGRRISCRGRCQAEAQRVGELVGQFTFDSERDRPGLRAGELRPRLPGRPRLRGQQRRGQSRGPPLDRRAAVHHLSHRRGLHRPVRFSPASPKSAGSARQRSPAPRRSQQPSSPGPAAPHRHGRRSSKPQCPISPAQSPSAAHRDKPADHTAAMQPAAPSVLEELPDRRPAVTGSSPAGPAPADGAAQQASRRCARLSVACRRTCN